MLRACLGVLALFLCAPRTLGQSHTNVETVFLVLMENVNWPILKTNVGSAPYLVNTLLPMASSCDQYYTPPGLPGSLPNYFWLEAGTNYGITDSSDPGAHVLTTTNHLTTQLRAAGISWKAYVENISGTNCPTASSGLYAAYHNPFVYFTDIISNAPYCLAHLRPYDELAGDLASNTVARYNFIVPNLCHDSHNSSGCATADRIKNGDLWMAAELPKILGSQAWSNNGALFITWDEGSGGGLNGPIGMLLLSPLAKGHGYVSTNRQDHASTRRTMQEIFGVRPLLQNAARATSLGDLFKPRIYLRGAQIVASGAFQFTTEVEPGKTNLVQVSTNLEGWVTILTNRGSSLRFVDDEALRFPQRLYRVLQLP